MKQSFLGFTLIELLIVISLVSILAMIALPTYQHYTRRAYYSELVQAAAPYQLGVGECYQELGSLEECGAGVNGIPAAINEPQGLVAAVDVAGGVITLVPSPLHGLTEEDDYILTPVIVGERLVWKIGGGGVGKGYVKGS